MSCHDCRPRALAVNPAPPTTWASVPAIDGEMTRRVVETNRPAPRACGGSALACTSEVGGWLNMAFLVLILPELLHRGAGQTSRDASARGFEGAGQAAAVGR